MNMRAEKNQERRKQASANGITQKREDAGATFQFADNRSGAVQLLKLQAAMNDSPQVQQLAAFQQGVDGSQRMDSNQAPLQAMATGAVAQLERTVTNRMKTNMQQSLARVFGGPASRYEIDQESGTTFSDGKPNYTTGHHGVKVTDTQTGEEYSCDFHQDGAYYTRG